MSRNSFQAFIRAVLILLIATCVWSGQRLVLADANETAVNDPNAASQSAISLGTHSCALLTTGAVQCWGYNNYGQLGDGTTTNKNTPTQVTGLTSGVTAIAASDLHTCALLTTGAVQCWGWNYYGEVGDGTTTDRSTPTQVTGLTSGVTAISAGGYHSCVLLTAGAVQCWGDNGHGQLGDGTTTSKTTPTQVSGLTSGVTAISAGNTTPARSSPPEQ